MNLARTLAQRTNVAEDDVRKLLDELPAVILGAATRGEQVRIPRLGKFEVRRRRRYLNAKEPSKITGTPFGLRMRLGLFFQSYKSFDLALERQLGWVETREAKRTQACDPDAMLGLMMRLKHSV